MSAAVRPARLGDIDALLSIENAAFSGDRIARQGFRRMIGSRSSSLLVAVDSREKVIGYCAVLFRSGAAKARLYSVAVLPGKSGIGRSLIAAAEESASARGCEEIRLEVRRDNARAIELYGRSGYLQFGTKPDYYADGATALRFHKSLRRAFDKASKLNAVASGTAIP